MVRKVGKGGEEGYFPYLRKCLRVAIFESAGEQSGGDPFTNMDFLVRRQNAPWFAVRAGEQGVLLSA
mgnify:CR=1 FL=1